MENGQLERIHAAGLQVLEQTGAVFQHEVTVTLLKAAGCRADGQRVFIPAAVVERALASAPGGFEIEGRAPDRAVNVGDGSLVITNGSGPALISDGTEVRPLTMDSLGDCIRLCHAAGNVDLLGYFLASWRGSDTAGYLRSVHAALTLTDKPMEFPLAEPHHLRAALDLAEIVGGGAWHERPRLFVVLNSVSPLVFPEHFCETARELAGRAQPLCVTPCAMGGTTGPVTVAGLLVLQHAEVLAGLVLTQLTRPGAPFLYGGFSAPAQLQTGDLMVGAPQFWTIAAATAKLARFLGLPVRCGGGVTDAHAPDMQAGLETALGLASAIEAGAHLILHGSGLLGTLNAFSPAKFVIDDEIAGMLRRRPWHFVTDDESLALDAIAAAGPGGSYLPLRHTRRHAHDFELPRLFNRRPYDVWLQGGRDLDTAAAARVNELLEGYQRPPGDPVVDAQLKRYCLA